jgi:hypothetical protein
MSDGTQLNPGASGDLIADEDMTGTVRLSPLVPQLSATNASYKIERTKIAIGDYGQDRGDPTLEGRAFPVETGAERRILELAFMRQTETSELLQRMRASERTPLTMTTRSSRDGRAP